MLKSQSLMWALIDLDGDAVVGVFPLKFDAVRYALVDAGVPPGSPAVAYWCMVNDNQMVTAEQSRAMEAAGLTKYLVTQVDVGVSHGDVWSACMVAVYQPTYNAGPAPASVTWPF